MSVTLNASLEDGSAVLRFPYDERLRQLLRAIPRRRWDVEARVWRVPIDEESAESLTRLLAAAPHVVDVSEALGRTLERRRARRRPQECVLDLARPDESWWFSFATDHAGDLVEELLAHPDARRLPAIARGLIPLDEHAAEVIGAMLERSERLRLTEDASHALVEIGQPRNPPPREPAPAWDVALRRGRGGGAWIVISPEHAPLARALAASSGLAARDDTGSATAFAALDADAARIAELIAALEQASVDPRVSGWLERATTWHGTIDVDGASDQPRVHAGGTRRPPPAGAARAGARGSGRRQPAAHARPPGV